MLRWDDSAVSPEDVTDFIRMNTTCAMRHDERSDARKYVVGADGHLVMMATHAMINAAEVVLFVPSEQERSLEVQVALLDVDPNGADADRWRIYHGQTREPIVAKAVIQAVKYHAEVFDGVAIVKPNPLAADEPAICRMMNKERPDDLRSITRLATKVEGSEPTMVGVHPVGLDVRLSLGVVCALFPERATGGEHARRMIDELAKTAAARAGESA